MKVFFCAAFFALFCLLFFLKVGVSVGSVLIFLIIALMSAVIFYFATLDRSKPASSLETALATTWLWLRRVVGFTVGGWFLYGALTTMSSLSSGKSESDVWIESIALTLGAVFMIYLGVFGQGPTRSQLKDDVRQHAENKKRYKWWF